MTGALDMGGVQTSISVDRFVRMRSKAEEGVVLGWQIDSPSRAKRVSTVVPQKRR
jgi:hypothetical protein